MVHKSDATLAIEAVLRKAKKQKKGKKGRKIGRNFRYYGIKEHSQTLYRSRGQREKNKARRAAKRERRLQRLKDKRHAIYLKEHGTGQEADFASGSGPSQRED